MADTETFDCFLSHNSRDKPAVRALAAELRARGVSVWRDEEQLRPGFPWQDELERGIRASRSIAVLVGADGLGPWERKEMRAALVLAVNDGRPVIPVLLAAAPRVPELPMFLQDHTWVDFRARADAEGAAGIAALYRGITGRRSGPGEAPVAPPPPSSLPPPPFPWARATTWGAGLTLVALTLWSWLQRPASAPAPWLVNRPTPGWIGVWTGELGGQDGGADTPVGVRLRIGADQSRLELLRRDQVTCVTPVAVEVEERRAHIWSPGPVSCPDGRALGEFALHCREAGGGGADCTGRSADGRPPVDRQVHTTLARVGGGDWPTPSVESPPAVAPQPADAGASGASAATPAGPAPTPTPTPTATTTTTEVGPIPGASVILYPLKGGGQAPAMIPLPAGCFMMGSPPDEPERESDEGPQHRVCVESFAIGRTEVTFAQYDRFAEATGRSKPDHNGWGRGEQPVINVSWDDAVAYTRWLSAQTGHTYRLPTEAEWEYAARAGTETPFWTGACINTDLANYRGDYGYQGCGTSKGVYRNKSVPVASLPPNPWGLYEVAGNVWEWVQDTWHANYQGAPNDGSAWEGAAGERRVLRGGGWLNVAQNLRSAPRGGDAPGSRRRHAGFRLALGPEPSR